MSRSLCLDSLSDDELLCRLSTLVAKHRRCEAELVAHIAEVDARRLYLGKACSSMFSYCTEVLHLSEHEAYLRLAPPAPGPLPRFSPRASAFACARASRRSPVLLDMLGDGCLHLSAIAKLAPHLTEDNAETLLARAVHKTTREIEELCAEVAPRPDVPSRMRKLPRARPRRQPGDQLGTNLVPGATAEGAARSTTSAPAATAGSAATAAVVTNSEPTAFEKTGPEVVEAPAVRVATGGASEAPRAVIEPIAPARFKVQFTASAELRDKLCRAKALLRCKDRDADLDEVIDEAVTLLLGKLEAKRFGKTKTPRKTLADTDTSASSRCVPAAVRRVVFERDGAQCTFVDKATGRRCSCVDPGELEFHHVDPFARRTHHDPEKLTLRCRAHNAYQAELDFGPETISLYRTGTSRAREPQAAYGPLPAQWAPRVADPRGAAGALPGCAGPPKRTTAVRRRSRPRRCAQRPAGRAGCASISITCGLSNPHWGSRVGGSAGVCKIRWPARTSRMALRRFVDGATASSGTLQLVGRMACAETGTTCPLLPAHRRYRQDLTTRPTMARASSATCARRLDPHWAHPVNATQFGVQCSQFPRDEVPECGF